MSLLNIRSRPFYIRFKDHWVILCLTSPKHDENGSSQTVNAPPREVSKRFDYSCTSRFDPMSAASSRAQTYHGE